MIEYSLSEQTEIPPGGDGSVKVIGVGGAGANVLDRMALEGSDEADLLTLNTDVRALSTSVSTNKLQLGTTLLKGMGAGGDPELGRQAALEAIDEIRESVRGYKMAFVCVGLGGGTGSGAAPEVCRVAKEEGVFLVVFATLPFSFEGKRRMDQALEALDRIGDYANAVITFENDRMGELIVPKEGVQQAFAAADKIISQSIRATTGIVSHPGIIRIGMDELLSALDTKKSRCLFGFGQAKGDNRAHEALEQALKSPLLDKGKLLQNAKNVLIHVGGGDGMTLFEIELVMQELSKHIDQERTQILFGTGTDKSLGSSLTVTVISSLEGPDGPGDGPPRGTRDKDQADVETGFSPPQSTSPLAGAVEALENDSTETEPQAAVEELEEEAPAEEVEAAAELEGEEPAAVEEIFETEEKEAPEAVEPEAPPPPPEEEPPVIAAEEEEETVIEAVEETEEEVEAAVEEILEDAPKAAEVPAADSTPDSEETSESDVESAVDKDSEPEVEDEPEAEVEDEPEAEVEDEPEAEVEDEPEAKIEELPDSEPEAEKTVEPEIPQKKVIQSIPKRKPIVEAPKGRGGKRNIAPVPPKSPLPEEDDSGAWSDLESPDSIGKLLQQGRKANEQEAAAAKASEETESAEPTPAPEADYGAETVPVTPVPPKVSISDLARKSRAEAAAPESKPEQAEEVEAEPAAAEVEVEREEMIVAETDDAQKISLSRLVPGSGASKPAPKPAEMDQPAAPAAEAEVESPLDPAAGGPLDLAGDEIDAVTAQQQQMLQLEPLSKGRFAKTEPTIVDGEDMDVPTFLRKRRK